MKKKKNKNPNVKENVERNLEKISCFMYVQNKSVITSHVYFIYSYILSRFPSWATEQLFMTKSVLGFYETFLFWINLKYRIWKKNNLQKLLLKIVNLSNGLERLETTKKTFTVLL